MWSECPRRKKGLDVLQPEYYFPGVPDVPNLPRLDPPQQRPSAHAQDVGGFGEDEDRGH